MHITRSTALPAEKYITPDTQAVYGMDYHGTMVLSLRSDDGTWRHLVSSKSHPASPHRVTVHISGGYLIDWHCTCPAFTLSPKTNRRCCSHAHAAAVVEYTLDDELWHIASLRKSHRSGDDWAWADVLEKRICIWKRGDVAERAMVA